MPYPAVLMEKYSSNHITSQENDSKGNPKGKKSCQHVLKSLVIKKINVK